MFRLVLGSSALATVLLSLALSQQLSKCLSERAMSKGRKLRLTGLLSLMVFITSFAIGYVPEMKLLSYFGLAAAMLLPLYTTTKVLDKIAILPTGAMIVSLIGSLTMADNVKQVTEVTVLLSVLVALSCVVVLHVLLKYYRGAEVTDGKSL